MTIYLDADYCCHVSQDADNALIATEISALDGKCRTYIEGYRYVPEGATWTREDGEQFTGPMITPWRDYALLETAQGAYEDALAQMQPQIDDVLVALVEV